MRINNNHTRAIVRTTAKYARLLGLANCMLMLCAQGAQCFAQGQTYVFSNGFNGSYMWGANRVYFNVLIHTPITIHQFDVHSQQPIGNHVSASLRWHMGNFIYATGQDNWLGHASGSGSSAGYLGPTQITIYPITLAAGAYCFEISVSGGQHCGGGPGAPIGNISYWGNGHMSIATGKDDWGNGAGFDGRFHYTLATSCSSCEEESGPVSATEISPPLTAPNLGVGWCAKPNGGFLRFGGVDFPGVNPSNQTFALDGSTWTQQFSQHNPPPMAHMGMVLDEARSQVLLLGGTDPTTGTAETWTWQNGQWTRVLPATSPPPGDRKLAYDSTRHRVLAYGGLDSTLWSWDGSNWTAIHHNGAPGPRHQHGMAYNSHRDRVVLIGGTSLLSYGRLNDIWEWDGATQSWTGGSGQIPEGTWDVHACFDPRAGRVLFTAAGSVSGSYMWSRDIWSCDGTRLTRHFNANWHYNDSPLDRYGSAMAYDAVSQRTLMHGGHIFYNFTHSETWEITLPSYSSAHPYGTGCSGSVGVPLLAADPSTRAKVGSSLRLVLSNIPNNPLNVPFGAYDFQASHFSGMSIPADLSSLGLPGCHALTGAQAIEMLQAAVNTNETSWVLPIPNIPALVNVSVYLQGFVLENQPGRFASLSNGLRVRIGTR